MICPKCGESLPDEAVFCVNCGTELAPESKAEPAFRAPIRWPIIIPILMLIGFLTRCAVMAAQTRYYWVLNAEHGAAVNMPGVLLLNSLPVFITLAAAVLFFTPTRRVPTVTAIPRILLAAFSVVSLATYLGAEAPESFRISQIVSFAVSLVPVVLYIIGCAAKPRTFVIALIHLALTLVLSIIPFFQMDNAQMLNSGNELYRLIAVISLLSAAANLFAGAAYSIALFFTRRKYYTGE